MHVMIAVDELIKQYDRAKEPAVKGVSFDVGEGDFFAFLGPNGAGGDIRRVARIRASGAQIQEVFL